MNICNNLFDIRDTENTEFLLSNVDYFPRQIFRHLDINDMKSNIAVVEENGNGCINYHDNERDDRQDQSL